MRNKDRIGLDAAIFLPQAAPLIAPLMPGNLRRESGMVDGLGRTSQEAIINSEK